MKKIITVIALFLAVGAKAQFQTQILVGEQLKAVGEYTYSDDKIFLYSYVETSEAYWWLQQIAEVNIYNQWMAHAEYRTGDVLLAGVAKGINIKDGFISLSGLARYEGQIMPQIGGMWQYAKKRIDLYGYIDVWWNGTAQMFLEQRFYYEIMKGVAVGVVVNVMRYDDWNITPYAGIKITL